MLEKYKVKSAYNKIYNQCKIVNAKSREFILFIDYFIIPNYWRLGIKSLSFYTKRRANKI